MGHANRNSMEVLRKTPHSGVEYNGNLTPCDVCPFGKSEQQPHPKQASYDVQRPFEHATVGSMGLINPPALAGYTYVTKFVDQVTKWKESFLVKRKTHTIDSLELFNTAVVIPSGEQVVRVRGDKGTEFTSEEFRLYCLDAGVKLDLRLRTPLSRSARRSGQVDRLLLLCAVCSLSRVSRVFSGGN